MPRVPGRVRREHLVEQVVTVARVITGVRVENAALVVGMAELQRDVSGARRRNCRSRAACTRTPRYDRGRTGHNAREGSHARGRRRSGSRGTSFRRRTEAGALALRLPPGILPAPPRRFGRPVLRRPSRNLGRTCATRGRSGRLGDNWRCSAENAPSPVFANRRESRRWRSCLMSGLRTLSGSRESPHFRLTTAPSGTAQIALGESRAKLADVRPYPDQSETSAPAGSRESPAIP